MNQLPYSVKGKKVWVAGHRGMVGSALVRRLASEECKILTVPRSEVDLRDQAAVQMWMRDNKPDVVIIAAAKVGGILANDTYPADFLYDNLMLEANIIHASHNLGVEKLLFLGSVCIYPKFAPMPVEESSLLTGPLEPTNEWYAIAKIAGIKLAQAYRKQFGDDYISAMPANLYGPGDNYDLQSSHVIPALIRKAHEAKLRGDKSITIWGSGKPYREFVNADDCADALVFLLKNYSGHDQVNIGSGKDIQIIELARLICDVVDFKGEIICDTSKPDGTPRRLMSSEVLKTMGWTPQVEITNGLAHAYQCYLESLSESPHFTQRV